MIGADGSPDGLADYGVSVAHVAGGLDAYAPAGWAQAVVELIGGLARRRRGAGERPRQRGAGARGCEDRPADGGQLCVDHAGRAGFARARALGRQLARGEPLARFADAADGRAPRRGGRAGGRAGHGLRGRVHAGDPAADLVARVSERASAATAGVSLDRRRGRRLWRSGRRLGRGIRGDRRARGAPRRGGGLLAGGDECRLAPAPDQVGQTGTKISPEIYIACGISGATQHMAGCKGAKKLLGDQPDGEASIFASADYAVIGDLHESCPRSRRDQKGEGAHSLARRRGRPRRRDRGERGPVRASCRLAPRLVRSARPSSARRRARRVRNEVTIVLGQRKLLQRFGPGLMHAFIFWGSSCSRRRS